jgi:hypothetical protein
MKNKTKNKATNGKDVKINLQKLSNGDKPKVKEENGEMQSGANKRNEENRRERRPVVEER